MTSHLSNRTSVNKLPSSEYSEEWMIEGAVQLAIMPVVDDVSDVTVQDDLYTISLTREGVTGIARLRLRLTFLSLVYLS